MLQVRMVKSSVHTHDTMVLVGGMPKILCVDDGSKEPAEGALAGSLAGTRFPQQATRLVAEQSRNCIGEATGAS